MEEADQAMSEFPPPHDISTAGAPFIEFAVAQQYAAMWAKETETRHRVALRTVISYSGRPLRRWVVTA